MNRIQELEAEIQCIKKEESDKKIAQYQYLVGKCLRISRTSYIKIQYLYDIRTDSNGESLCFDCLHISFDNEGYVSHACISLDSYSDINVKHINDWTIINIADFNNILDACIDYIKRRMEWIVMPIEKHGEKDSQIEDSKIIIEQK